jgi:cytochrome c oxidase subunit 3
MNPILIVSIVALVVGIWAFAWAPSAGALPCEVKPHPVTGIYNGKLGLWLFLASEVMLFGALFSAYILLRTGTLRWPAGTELGLDIPLAAFNTAVLIASSVTMVMAWASLKLDNPGNFRKYLGATILCAFIFLGVKYVEYTAKFNHFQVWFKDGSFVTGHLEDAKDREAVWNDKDWDKIKLHPDAKQLQPGAMAVAMEGEHAKEMEIDHDAVKRVHSFGPGHSAFTAIYFTITGLHGLHILGGILVNLYLLTFGFSLWKHDREHFENRIECAGLYWHFVDLVWIFLFPVLYLTPGSTPGV